MNILEQISKFENVVRGSEGKIGNFKRLDELQMDIVEMCSKGKLATIAYVEIVQKGWTEFTIFPLYIKNGDMYNNSIEIGCNNEDYYEYANQWNTKRLESVGYGYIETVKTNNQASLKEKVISLAFKTNAYYQLVKPSVVDFVNGLGYCVGRQFKRMRGSQGLFTVDSSTPVFIYTGVGVEVSGIVDYRISDIDGNLQLICENIKA